MLRHQLAFISFLLIFCLFPAFIHAQGKFMGGSVTVDAGGAGDFMSLREAAENYNTYGITGHTTLVIASDLTETQTAQFGNVPGSGTYKLTITTDGTRRMVSGDINGPVIRLYGANNITIDGIAQATASNPTGNMLVVQNTHTVEAASVGTIHVIPDGAGKGSNIVIRNTEMGNAVWDTQGIANLLVSTDSIRVEGCYLHGANENLIAQNLRRLVFKNNVVTDSKKSGLSVTMYYPEQCVINGNVIDNITNSGSGDRQLQGIFLSSAGLGTLTITGNIIRNINNQMTGDAGAYGMVLSTDGYLNISNNTISSISNASDNPAHSAAGIFCILGELWATGGVADLKNNIIDDITDHNFPFGITIFAGAASARGFATGNTITGITASASMNGNNAAGIAMNAPGVVSGNHISGIVAPAGSAKGLYGQHLQGDVTLMYNNFLSGIAGKAAAGIYIESGTGFKAYHNTVFLSGKNDASDEAACVVLSTDAELRNNLLVNTAPGNANNNQAVVLQSASPVLSGNRYYIANGVIGKTAANTGYGNINAWNAATGDNSVRLPNAPAFTSAKDLHLSGISTTDPLLHTALLTDVPKDIDGTSRLSCSNAAGADNFSATPAFSFGNFSARTACLTMPSYINFEVTGGVAPFSYKVDGGAQTNIAVDSITLAGNRAFSFNRVLGNGSHTIQVTDAGNCTFTTSQTLAINATGTSIWHVNQAVAVSGDGITPATAFKDLQEALDNTCLKTNDTIKIAKGTYVPSKIVSGTGVQDKVFYITKSIHLKGAYNPGFTERDTVAYKTLLSGDIGIQDDNTDNTYHVIIWNSSDAVNGSIDGFVICDGNANGGASTVVARGNGGGLFHNKGGLKIANTTVRNNETSGNGGGIFSTAALTIEGSAIYRNISGQSGAGVYSNTTLILVMKNVTISGNKAGYTGTIYNGGGIYVNNSLTLQGQIIVKDNTASAGGGIWKSTGGIFDVTGLTSLTITGNEARNGAGGGIYAGVALDLSPLSSGNISDNTAGTTGGGIHAVGALTVNNFKITGNTAGNTGGGIHAVGVLTMKNSTVSNNKSGYTGTGYSATVYHGGAVYAANALTLAGKMVFENDTASGGGGAIYKNGTTTFDVSKLDELTVKGNVALNGTGGGIYTAAALDLSGVSIGNILNNTASQHGGGIYANLALSLGNSVVSGNKAGYKAGVYSGVFHGGGIYATNTLTLAGNMVFENDTTSGNGGAIYKIGTTTFDVSKLDELTVKGNTALNGMGGGIYTAAVLDLSGVSIGNIHNNTASQHGGGIYTPANVALSLANSVVSGNKAGYKDGVYSGAFNGGGIYASNVLTLAGNMVFENDTASGNGGAIYKNGATEFKVSGLIQLTMNNNAANTASASNNYIGGGAIWTGASLDLSRILAAEFKNNSAQGKGGAVCAGATTVELAFNNTVFSNNKSGYDFLAKTYTTTGDDNGGAVYAYNNLTLKGKLNFDGNISGASGGGIWKSATGNIDVTGLNELSVTGNEARGGEGGGISTMALSLELSGVNKVTVSDNKASKDGGGIYMGKILTTAFARLSLQNTTISNNKAGWNFAINDYGTDPYNGGGVYVNMVALMLSGSVTFENNGASGNGGAIWKKAIFKSSIGYDDGPFDVTGLNVLNMKGNKAGISGGGIYTEAPLDFNNLKSGNISNNIAGQDGGAIFGIGTNLSGKYVGADMNMVNMRFSANTAGRYGGSIYAGDILETSQSIFTGNSAMSGGALYKVATGSMTVQKSTFTGNRADNGGAITSMLAAQTIFNSTFSGNTAASNGGAVCFATASAASNVITYCTFNNNRTDDNVVNAIYYTNPNGSLKGNIIYGNGTGTEINNIAGLTTQYNIVRNPTFAGTGDQNTAAGNGANIFASPVGDIAAPAGNGGATPTILIKTNGLAHNQIVFDIAATFGPLGATDQRGENRVTGFTDIGSVELAPQPCSGTPEPVVWYVDAAAAAGGDGTSIPGRANDLNIVLTNPCLKDGDTIKVAQGTYYSTNTGSDKSFIVLKGITILGGYTSGFAEAARNIVTQPTILDGKSLSYHVVIWNTGSNNTGNIDGVTIRNGKATGSTPFIFAQDNGGGILLNNGILTVSNSTVADNTAMNKGGGIHVSANTSLTLKNVTSRNNKAGHNGSAFITIAAGASAVQLETRSGGGISALGKLELQGNMVFEYDMAGGNGGGIFLGLQCAFVADKLNELTMTGCESKINSNAGDYGGGGIFTTLGIDLSNVKKAKFTDCIAMVQGGGIFINDKTGKLSVLKVANAGFTGCKALKDAGSADASDGGAIESYYGTQSVIVVRNSTFKNCYAARYGGALGIGNALRLEGSVKIDNCTSDNNGGGISQWGLNGLPAMFDVSALDTLVVTNCKSNLGGGIWVQGAPLDFSNTKYMELTGNFSKTHGGAIYLSNVTGGVTPYTLTLRNAIILRNGAGWDGSNYTGTNNGGGIYTTTSSPIVLKGNITFSNNTANGSGGGIYGATTITGVGLDTLKVTGNTAMTTTGGGIYAGGAMDLSGLKYGEISGNTAKTNGGGIYAGNALTLTRTTLYNNQADGNGGGIYKSATGNLVINKSTLSANAAVQGGAVYTAAGTNNIFNSTFSRNSASDNGGGLYATGTTVKVVFSTFNGNMANGGSNSGNALFFSTSASKTLYGNIIYGNGMSGAEISVAPATASYNIVRGMSLTGTGNANLATGLGNTVFKTVTGDLATLENNGGPTKTLMIAEQNQGGQAHNFIPVNTAKTFDATVTSDQRDSLRFAKCKADCGSVEIQHDIATYAFRQPWARACPYTLIDADTLIAKTANIKDTIYYSDKNYTQPLAMPVKNISRIYVKFTSLDGCVELRDTIKINLVPVPSVKAIGGKTRTVCSNGFIDLNVNTANAANIIWSGWERSGTATGANTETLHFTPFQRTSDTTFYVRATAHSNPECILTASDSVLLTLKGLPTAVIKGVSVVDTLCAGQPFSFKVKTTNSGYIEWIGGSGSMQPVRLSTSLTYAADSITFTYTPAATERGQLVNLRLKSGSGAGACGYIEKDVKLFVMPHPVPAAFKLVDQPKGLQNICVDTLYEVKIKSPKVGRMKDIRIGLFDENITKISVKSAEYKYPYTGATWQSLGNYALNNRNYRYTLPMPLQPDDSVLVRIHVRAGCDFTSGDVVKFTLDATDECGVTFPQQTIVSDKYTLRGDASVANKYTFKTAYTPLTVNSRTNDTVLVRMNIVIEGTQVTDASREKIVTFIPSGLNIDPLSLKTIRNAGTVTSSAVSGGTEYYMSIPSGIHPKDSVMYEFKISASDALCGTYTLRNQVYYEYEATCDAQTCPVSEIRASEIANIEVKRYTFTLHSIQGETRLGKWSGDIQMNAINGFFAGDSLKVDFYVDRNSDNRYQLADDGAAVAVRYVKTPVKNVDIPAGGILPVQFSGIPVEPGLQLIAHSTDPLLCAPMQFPITIITGPDTTCRDKVTTITLATGMKNYHVDVISGATLVLNSTLENLPNENTRKIKWVTASGDVPVKGGYTRTILGQDIPSEKTTFVTHVNPPVTAGGLKTKENVTEYCSPAKAKIYVENLKDASSIQWTASTKAGSLSGRDTDTLTYSFHSRANDTTLWVRFDAKALSDCEDYKDSIRLTIRASFDTGEISSVGQAFCVGQAMPNPIGSLAGATGGNQAGGYTYRWLVNGNEIENTNTAAYTPAVVLPGTYIYTREAKDTRCNTDFAASAGTWTLTINALPIPTITGAATVCAGQSLTLTAEAFFASYVWTVAPAGNVALDGSGTGNEETFTWSAVGTKTVTVTATDINGCEGTATADIEVTPKVDTGPIYRVPNRE